MTVENPDFSMDSKKRIAKVVRDAERTPPGGGNILRPSGPRDPDETCWARLLSRDGTDLWKYSWAEIRATKDGAWETVSGGRSGTTTEFWAQTPCKNILFDYTGRVALLRRSAWKEEADAEADPPVLESINLVWGIIDIEPAPGQHIIKFIPDVDCGAAYNEFGRLLGKWNSSGIWEPLPGTTTPDPGL